ncbi:hypothetical protein ACLIMP_17440 [Novosphingobium aerophilum]|uniref:hypothetical protein n=1 Tax=Novosphingobium TaxID=165696 RepID=UPI0012C4C11D|nr:MULTISPECIES: hypothetical protein [unclassified Novosphingobium]MPS68674.1 hypothetical protein [Novosphingobium sp.]WRT95961.1 hypothetical protein U9J33_20475 [Novosphingobium sp. RL4]
MAYSNRSLRRRPRVERRVLSLLRGEETLAEHAACFVRLRTLATRRALTVLQPGTLYLGDDELTLLGWIAAAQRQVSRRFRPDDRCLAASIERCAGILDEAGLHLHPLTLYEHWLRGLE